jgi:probable addiction module antidote protein
MKKAVVENSSAWFFARNTSIRTGLQRSIHPDTLRKSEYAASLVRRNMKKKKTTYKPFDAAVYLDNDAVIAEYLSAAAEDPNPEVFVAALGEVAKARGMAQIAKDAGLGRESLYKTLSAGAHPRFETINSVLHALGVKFAVVAEHES